MIPLRGDDVCDVVAGRMPGNLPTAKRRGRNSLSQSFWNRLIRRWPSPSRNLEIDVLKEVVPTHIPLATATARKTIKSRSKKGKNYLSFQEGELLYVLATDTPIDGVWVCRKTTRCSDEIGLVQLTNLLLDPTTLKHVTPESPPAKRRTAESDTINCRLGIVGICHKFETQVPIILLKCVREVERRGLDCEGIYRLPGSHSRVQKLRDTFNNDPLGIDLSDESNWDDLNAICSLIKAYIRNLVEPLLTTEMYDKFIQAGRVADKGERLHLLKGLVQQLPPLHFTTLQWVIEHLSHVVEHCEANKMSRLNIGIVFGPTIVRPATETINSILGDMLPQCTIVEVMVGNAKFIFGDVNKSGESDLDESFDETETDIDFV